jgi:hypothetical protein
MRRALLACCAALVAGASFAQEIRPHEQARLDRFDALAGRALLDAMASGTPQDVLALGTALSGVPQVAFDPALNGDWRCRTIKLGGSPQLVVYAQFECRMTLDARGVTFEKPSGSERTSGRIEMRDGRAVYLGVGYGASGAPQPYTGLAPDFEGSGTVSPEVAVFERVSDTRARLLFPAPLAGSDFDILELTR